MQTLGYRFKPWSSDKAIADGPAILEYVRETAREAGIDRRIRYGHRGARASWADGRWAVGGGGFAGISCDFLYVGGGYYPHDGGYRAGVPGFDAFGGAGGAAPVWP